MRLKPLNEQIIVITGASSGIGLVTARMAAERGARLVLAARSEDALRQLTDEIRGRGGQATYVVADVGVEDDVRRIARVAIDTFGGFDTWVNDAGVSIYGRMEDVPLDDMRKLFDTNVWGVVHGSLEAAKHLRGHGGTIINIGSILSDIAIPIQGIYSASKHAVKGFTDAFRLELEADGAPIVVTLIKPSAIDTPYTEHAMNYMDTEATVPPPVYAPETVADAILHCCETPERELVVGGGGRMMIAMGENAPRLTDKVLEHTIIGMQRGDGPPQPRSESGLYHAAGSLNERGSYDGMVMERSLYTQSATHPLRTAGIAVGVGLIAAALWKQAQGDDQHASL
jgi:short-subunit dehydrogenase